MKTIIKFKVLTTNEDTQKAYERFVAMLALRGYEFSVKRKWVASACKVFTITVVDMDEADAEWAKYRLGAF